MPYFETLEAMRSARVATEQSQVPAVLCAAPMPCVQTCAAPMPCVQTCAAPMPCVQTCAAPVQACAAPTTCLRAPFVCVQHHPMRDWCHACLRRRLFPEYAR